MIEQKRQQYGWNVPKRFEKSIYQLSGGIPGIIKRLCSYVNHHNDLSINNLIKDPFIEFYLKDFSPIFSKDNPQLSIQLKLMDGNKIKSKLIEKYINRQKYSALNPPLKIKLLLDYFYKNINTLVTIDDIIDLLGNRNNFSLWGNYKLLERMKKYLPNDKYLINVKGKGYILKDGRK